VSTSIVDGLASEERVPFHQLLLGLIREVNSVPELNSLKPFVFRGEIPKDHERIAEVWKEKCKTFGREDLGENGAASLRAHAKDIEEKKREIREEASKVVESIVNQPRD
jgi:hypothetical protein